MPKSVKRRSQETSRTNGWTYHVWKAVEDIGSRRFSLAEVYAYREKLSRLYPSNHHVQEKIRQQLQILRDQGKLRFLARGEYERKD